MMKHSGNSEVVGWPGSMTGDLGNDGNHPLSDFSAHYNPTRSAVQASASIPDADIAPTAIRHLLAGKSPNGIAPSDCGPWREVYEALCNAHTSGGTEAVHKTFDVLVKDDLTLARLVAGDPLPAPLPQDRDDSDESDDLDDAEHFTDLGNAQRLVRLHGHDLRFVYAWGWMTWDGRRWERDVSGAVARLAKETVLSFYSESEEALDRAKAATQEARQASTLGDKSASKEANKRATKEGQLAAALAKWARQCENRARLENMVKLAESEAPITVRSSDFDTDPWLLNVSNGTVDLRTGELREHRREDLLTKLAPVTYESTARCPTWLAFLDRIMASNRDLTDFLQRAAGYALTGDVREQVLFFLYGEGANGKSTFLNTLMTVLGKDYATQSAPDLLVQSKDRHPTELADLLGVRFLASIEVADGKRLAEALVKQLTGGDRVKARFMREDFFEFNPTHKIFFAANHRPEIRGTDHAIWRRILLIPFAVIIPEGEQDKQLPEKLKAEYPGILAWAVRGCLAWQREGLGIPATVKAATGQYRAESDTLSQFLADCTRPGRQVQARELYKAYQSWVESTGRDKQDILSLTRFGNALKQKDIDKYQDTSSHRTYYLELELVE
jgi:putative DNA primase/helicase